MRPAPGPGRTSCGSSRGRSRTRVAASSWTRSWLPRAISTLPGRPLKICLASASSAGRASAVTSPFTIVSGMPRPAISLHHRRVHAPRVVGRREAGRHRRAEQRLVERRARAALADVRVVEQREVEQVPAARRGERGERAGVRQRRGLGAPAAAQLVDVRGARCQPVHDRVVAGGPGLLGAAALAGRAATPADGGVRGRGRDPCGHGAGGRDRDQLSVVGRAGPPAPAQARRPPAGARSGRRARLKLPSPASPARPGFRRNRSPAPPATRVICPRVTPKSPERSNTAASTHFRRGRLDSGPPAHIRTPSLEYPGGRSAGCECFCTPGPEFRRSARPVHPHEVAGHPFANGSSSALRCGLSPGSSCLGGSAVLPCMDLVSMHDRTTREVTTLLCMNQPERRSRSRSVARTEQRKDAGAPQAPSRGARRSDAKVRSP